MNCGAGRCALLLDLEIGEANTLIGEFVNLWGVNGTALNTDVTPSPVIESRISTNFIPRQQCRRINKTPIPFTLNSRRGILENKLVLSDDL